MYAVHKKSGQIQISPLRGKPYGPYGEPRSIGSAQEYIREWARYNPYWEYMLRVNDVLITGDPYQKTFLLEE